MKLVRNTLTLAGVAAALLMAAPASASDKCDDAVAAATNTYVEGVLEVQQYCEQIKLRGGRCTTVKTRETRAAALAVVVRRDCVAADLADFRPGTCGGNAGGDLTAFIDCVVRSSNTWIDYMVASLFGLPVPPVPSPAPSGPIQPPTPTPDPDQPTPTPVGPPTQTPGPKVCQPLVNGPCLNAQFQGCCNTGLKCLFNALGAGVCVPPPPERTAAPRCGDGVVSGSEVCDGSALGSQTCQTQGFDGGTLSCNGSCTGFVTDGCTKCGNGVKEGSEQCDGSVSETCDDLVPGSTGTPTCTASCTINTSGCELVTCGNGIIDAGEECDGSNFGGATCISEGFGSGSLACEPSSCQLDTSNCDPCGNNVREGNEVCDGTDLAGETCGTQTIREGGTLGCSADCEGFDLSLCETDTVIEGMMQLSSTLLD